MKAKYGDKSVKYLHVWAAEYGFPIGGTLKLKNLQAFESKLRDTESEMRKKRKMSVKKFEKIESYRECLEMWKTEAENRNRKTLQNQLPFSKDNNQMCDVTAPHS
ncbi:hypothetical protein NQD34_003398 [Periophthalmus magnuspinnatus]|nr:hypothetical protein NQD34_003398 [Periophthalmus magnuspinnatus]